MSIDTLEDLVLHISGMAEIVGQEFQTPDADWLPMVFAFRKNDDGDDMFLLAFDDMNVKNATDDVRQFVQMCRPTYVVVLSSVWLTPTTPGEPVDYEALQSHPARREALTFIGIAEDETLVASRNILRTDFAPPVLTEIETFPEPLTDFPLVDVVMEAIG